MLLSSALLYHMLVLIFLGATPAEASPAARTPTCSDLHIFFLFGPAKTYPDTISGPLLKKFREVSSSEYGVIHVFIQTPLAAMTSRVHPLWGQIKDHYDSTYVYGTEVAQQEVIFSPCVSDALHNDVQETIIKLRALGKSALAPDWDDDSSCVTLSMLHSVIEHMPFSCSLPKLGNPLLVHGCIKLMQSITRFGRPSPFSYEYGHLCFRILVVAFNYCVINFAIPYDEWIEDVASQELQQLQEGHIPVLSKRISEIVLDRLTWGDDDDLYCALVRSEEWEDSYNSYEGPLVTPDHIHTLQRLLDEDQKHFLIFLRSHYSVCLSGLLYAMYRHIDFKRFPLDPGFHHAFYQFYCRTLLLAPGYPLGESIHQDLMSMLEEHNFTLLDTGDSRLVLLAYIDRLTRLSGTGIHPRASPALALGLLQYAQMLVCSGCESLVPSVIRVTFQCIWRELVDGNESAIPLIEHCGQLLKCVLGLLEFLLERAKPARGILLDALDAIVEEGLINLVMRTLLVVRPAGAQTMDTKGPIGYLIHTAISIIQVFRTVISSTCIEHRFRHDIGSWIAFLENSPRVIIPKSHRFR